MTAIVMECKEADKHPNAESLRVYIFGCSKGEVRIVANMENVYEVGDHANIVLANCMLNDAAGTPITVSKIRGCRSHGMALGKTDDPVDTVVSYKFCEPPPPYDEEFNGFIFKKWPSIGALANVRKDLKATSSLRSVDYRGKIKLDGTNAAVQVRTDGYICAQSRNRLLNTEHDNGGFARWVDDNKDIFEPLVWDKDITIFGEWCGSGIQSNSAAIGKIGKKVFAIFAIQVEEEGLPFPLNARVIFEPEKITSLLEKLGGDELLDNENVFVLPWGTDIITLDYTDADKLKVGADIVNDIVAKVEACDPWVKHNFGVEGVGEGVVMYQVNDEGAMMREDFVETLFKAKGEKHKVTNQKKPAQIDPEVAKSIDEFVALFVTENRLNQIAGEVDPSGEFDMKLTGAFVKAFGADVRKESTAELEASKLEFKQVGGAVSKAASTWWRNKSNEV